MRGNLRLVAMISYTVIENRKARNRKPLRKGLEPLKKKTYPVTALKKTFRFESQSI